MRGQTVAGVDLECGWTGDLRVGFSISIRLMFVVVSSRKKDWCRDQDKRWQRRGKPSVVFKMHQSYHMFTERTLNPDRRTVMGIGLAGHAVDCRFQCLDSDGRGGGMRLSVRIWW